MSSEDVWAIEADGLAKRYNGEVLAVVIVWGLLGTWFGYWSFRKSVK